MKSPMATLWVLIAALCFSTLLAEIVLLGMFQQRGWFKAERIQRAKEEFYGVNRREIRTRLVDVKSVDGEATTDQLVMERALRSSDLPIRANVARRDSIEHGVERNSLRIDQSRYEQTRVGFDRALDADLGKLENLAIDSVQSLLEQLSPSAAKEHLMLMLTSPGDNDPKQALKDAVSVMRRMSSDRRRKVFAEFQSPEESAQVEAMLRAIRDVESLGTGPPGTAASTGTGAGAPDSTPPGGPGGAPP
jgi:hypothetical protein